ncbi:hypothetical protein [Aeromicrobium sp.]|uniref:hypothetical protein n=1 Tax=Aeromicrobium sp. TaxID=1871063 RepID=UPI0019C6E878|nr:hypothetical protein [Aeromicrobium sp.]MBC7630948.1 hypothetical protein [Aeromicrobium sp.]
MSDKVQQHTARIEYNNKTEFALFYKNGIAFDNDTTYPSLESAQWDRDHEDDAADLIILYRPTPKEWKKVIES